MDTMNDLLKAMIVITGAALILFAMEMMRP
jgi:hypothetical protein